MKKAFGWGILFIAVFLLAGPALAADPDELERRLNMLADEVDELKEQGEAGGVMDKVTVHGYGELHFNVPSDGRQTSFDNHRFVLGIHARLADWIHLNVEIDYEHAAQELEFEFGYLDVLIHPAVNFRTGVVLIPVGFLNEYHEPPLFWTVERPLVHNRIIPTTWNGAGGGIFGTPFEGVSYRLYVVNSLQSIREADCDGGSGALNLGGDCGRFRASSGIRSGRRQPDVAIAEDLAVTGRVEFTKLFPGLQVGASFYTGETTHDLISEGGRTTLIEGDIKYRWNWFEMNSTVAFTWIDDAAALNDFANMVDGVIPDEILGWNIQFGIHVPQLIGWNTRQDIVPFFLYEEIDTHHSVPSGFMRDPSRDLDVYHFGVAYLPIPDVSLKGDFQIVDKGDGSSDRQVNFGVAYMY